MRIVLLISDAVSENQYEKESPKIFSWENYFLKNRFFTN